MSIISNVIAQKSVQWSQLPLLPGGKGWAGMYAGVSHNTLIAMGGANFPGKYPWEGGIKKWYDEIYTLQNGKVWVKANQSLSEPSAYGISVSYENKIILVGGSNAGGHLSRVKSLEWVGEKIVQNELPHLPFPLANMGGTLIGDLIVIFGGSSGVSEAPLKKCLALNLMDIQSGWFEIDAWPGPERIFPVCTLYNGQCYLFGGETSGINSKGEKYRSILLDSYRLTLQKRDSKWGAKWEKLAPMPRGMSAGGTILPVLNDRFLFWGGVDAVTAQYKTPATHPGIIKSLLYYFPETDSWEYIGEQTTIPSRVTLPVVFWNNMWVYISGEVKPGIRTPTVVGVR